MEKIRNLRKAQKITQEKLAGMAGISRYSIINYESNKRSPRIKDLKKIANALDVPIEKLI